MLPLITKTTKGPDDFNISIFGDWFLTLRRVYERSDILKYLISMNLWR
jgi:hypothetical protein